MHDAMRCVSTCRHAIRSPYRATQDCGWLLRRLQSVAVRCRVEPLLLREAARRMGAEAAREALSLGLVFHFKPRDGALWVSLPLDTRETMLPF